MNKAIKIARMVFDGLSPPDQISIYSWMGKRVPNPPGPKRAEGTPMDSAVKWWLKKLKSGNVVPDAGWPATLLVDDLTSDYIAVLKRDHLTRRGNATAMGRFLKGEGAVEEDKSSVKNPGKVGPPRQRHYTLHPLDTCRAAFDAKHGPQGWSGVDAQEGVEECPEAE